MLGYRLEERPKEVYQIEITESGFIFKFRESLYQFLLKAPIWNELLQVLMSIPHSAHDSVARLEINLPFISFPNLSHKRIDWVKLGKCAEQVQHLLWFLNLPKDNFESSDIYLSDDDQLMAIETYYRKDTQFHASAMSVGFSKSICEKLSIKYPRTENSGMETFPNCEAKVADFHSRLSSTTQKQTHQTKKLIQKYGSGFTGIRVAIRAGCTPDFLVPGNCACLGTNPDDFMRDRDMDSHNLDNPLQQMAMLCGVVSFWNDVLKPLHKGVE